MSSISSFSSLCLWSCCELKLCVDYEGSVMISGNSPIVDLDQVLAQDMEGVQVQALQGKLTDAAEQCRLRLDHGVAPEDAKRLSAMMAACSAGLSLLPTIWHIQQERN